MSGQLSYKYQMPRGIAGSLYDMSPHAIDSRTNGESGPDAMKYGMGAVVGINPGSDVLIPTAASTAAEFEGVVMTGFTNEMDMAGEVKVHPLRTVGILRWGRAWVRVADGVTPAYGDPLYLIKSGADAGRFTNVSAGNIAINGVFIGGLGTGDVAPVTLHNQKA